MLCDTARLSQRYPLLRAMGFLASQHGQLGAIPPSPFLSVSPLESMRSGGAIPPLKRGISAILVRYKANGCYLERVLRSLGGVSRTGPPSSRLMKQRTLSQWPRFRGNTYTSGHHKHYRPEHIVSELCLASLDRLITGKYSKRINLRISGPLPKTPCHSPIRWHLHRNSVN